LAAVRVAPRVATPLESVLVPSVVLPTLKLTVPVAVLGVTVAVNRSVLPSVAELDAAETAVVVAVKLEELPLPIAVYNPKPSTEPSPLTRS
jgi:hypothetical protein